MAIRNIREEGDEILKKKSKEVELIDDKIKNLLDDMLETMRKYNGVGLAAVQVGVLKRLVVIEVDEEKPPLKLINPVIIETKGEQEVEEGCLSYPNKYAKVIRPMELTVEALNEDGKKIKIVATELMAQAIAHEVDHLEGITFVDKMIPGTLEVISQE